MTKKKVEPFISIVHLDLFLVYGRLNLNLRTECLVTKSVRYSFLLIM